MEIETNVCNERDHIILQINICHHAPPTSTFISILCIQFIQSGNLKLESGLLLNSLNSKLNMFPYYLTKGLG